MAEYTFLGVETVKKIVTVEAETEDEAREIAAQVFDGSPSEDEKYSLDFELLEV